MPEFIFGGDLPPEIKAQLEKVNDLQHMSYQDGMHRVQDFFASLNEEQLVALYVILGNAGDSPAGQTPMSNYYQGIISTFRLLKFSICFCGTKHNAEDFAVPDDMAAPDQSASQDHSTPADDFAVEQLPKAYPYLLEEYNMEVAGIPGNSEKFYLRCAGCHTPSVHMRDRMLRDPGVKGCSTCQQKQKWG